MTTQQQLDERYGRTPRPGRRKALWTIAAATAVLLVGALAWTTVATTTDDVRSEDTGFAVLDEHTVAIGLRVSGPPDREIACALEALDEDFGVVGWRVIVLAPSSERTRAFTEDVRTVSLATTGLVNSCWVT